MIHNSVFFIINHYFVTKMQNRLKFLLMVAGYLLGADKPFYALALLGLIIPQVFFQVKYTIAHMLKYCLQSLTATC